MLNQTGELTRATKPSDAFAWWRVGLLLVGVIAAQGTATAEPRPEGDTYRWQGELVSLDEDGSALTVKSRIVSREGLTGVVGLGAGDPIVITWSGFESWANGIRAVARDDGLGFVDGDRFRLRAEFVAADPAHQYLTFTIRGHVGSLAPVRALTRGTWATVTSPHRPSHGPAAVVAVDAYAPARAQRLAGPTPAASETYRWQGELVSLDEGGRALTVKSRIVTPDGLADVVGLGAGDPILITWSGFENRANGIRTVARDDGSGLWGSERFLLRAEFVAADPARQYLTFTVEHPADSFATMRALTSGAWAIVASPHRPSRGGEAVVTVDPYDPALRARRYVWTSRLVSLDLAEQVVAVSAPVEEHVFRYIDRFSEGDGVVLIWAPGEQGAVEAIRYLELREQSTLHHGYILPVEFISADATGQRINFKTKVPPRTISTLASMQPGNRIKVTSLFDQPGETAAILTVEPAADDAE